MATGDKIKKIRKERHISQKTLGEKLGVSAAMIGQYETGVRNPKFETLEKIAHALEVPVWKLLDTEIPGYNVYNFEKGGLTLISEDGDFITGEAAERLLDENYAAQGDILPAEFNDFSIFIGKMGYTISLEKGMYYLINGEKRIKITPDDLKTLVRTSKAMIRGLLEDIMNRE